MERDFSTIIHNFTYALIGSSKISHSYSLFCLGWGGKHITVTAIESWNPSSSLSACEIGNWAVSTFISWSIETFWKYWNHGQWHTSTSERDKPCFGYTHLHKLFFSYEKFECVWFIICKLWFASIGKKNHFFFLKKNFFVNYSLRLKIILKRNLI